MAKITTVEERKAWVHEMLDSATFEYFPLGDTNFTAVVATFKDGWEILGHSVCVNKADYVKELGEKFARENVMDLAKDHYWKTVGYAAHCGKEEI